MCAPLRSRTNHGADVVTIDAHIDAKGSEKAFHEERVTQIDAEIAELEAIRQQVIVAQEPAEEEPPAT